MARQSGAVALGLLLPLLPVGPAAAAATPAVPLELQDLRPTMVAPDHPVAATLTVNAASCVTVDELGVAVRDAQGRHLDFPGSGGPVKVCPGGHTLITGKRAFAAGRYTEFGWYRTGSTYHDLPAMTLDVAAGKIVQRSLSPDHAEAGQGVAATLRLSSESCIQVDEVGVGVRDEKDNNLDFPGTASNVTVCPEGYTFTSGTRALEPGTYEEFGWYRIGNTYHDLEVKNLAVAARATDPNGFGSLVLDEDFSGPLNQLRWEDDKSSAYRYGNHNPDDDKLDWLKPAEVAAADGEAAFTAKAGPERLENGKQAWDTGLLTTEGTKDNFEVRPGDYAEVRMRLPEQLGAWPALWTWREGGNEIDSFEYHPDNPHLLELSNRIRTAGLYYEDPEAIKPGEWVTVGVHYGADNNDWYVNHKLVFSDHTGTGKDWHAFLILNLSVVSGKYHPVPDGRATIETDADYLRVWRKTA
ncbi:glycoside hydrolase family 16 protein [Kitasatospora cineracea]|nr:hypothetical protein [Kitasatospora cineracea]